MFSQACVRNRWSVLSRALSLGFVVFAMFSANSFAATDWSAIQSDLQADGTLMPGNVLRFELVRQNLAITVNGVAVPSYQNAAIANGFIAFRPSRNGRFFIDGSLPAQETELSPLLAALGADSRIQVTAIAGRSVLETPRLTWVHFEATGDGASIASSLVPALAAIGDPQLDVIVIPGTNSVFDPASILPPKFLKLFDEGFVEQLTDIFAFYLPRPDEHEIMLGDERAEAGLGVGQSFYIQVPFSGGSNVTLNLDFALRSDEIQPVEAALQAGGFAITSQTSNFIEDHPHLYFVHASGSGDGFTLGNALYNAIQIIQFGSRRRHDHF
ncbi:MAG TPA: DUF1259 domain-containing protein [Acidobacteriaceae bacterium]|nr:DUF1259 domain-containing protein [Acidobacteriaceae bacterium]